MSTLFAGKWSEIARELEVLTKAVESARIELKRGPKAPKPLIDLGSVLKLLPIATPKAFEKPVTFTIAYGIRRVQAVVERDAIALLLKRLPESVDPAALAAEDLLQVIEFAAIDALRAAERAAKQPVVLLCMKPGDVTSAGKIMHGRLSLSGADYGHVKLVALPTLN